MIMGPGFGLMSFKDGEKGCRATARTGDHEKLNATRKHILPSELPEGTSLQVP